MNHKERALVVSVEATDVPSKELDTYKVPMWVKVLNKASSGCRDEAIWL